MANISTYVAERVGFIEITRPESLNSLSQQTLTDILEACVSFDESRTVGCIVIHGSERAFSAGGDITEMAEYDTTSAYMDDIFDASERFSRIRTPIVAAVNGVALGGGCELAMACDFIIAGDKARFGQPEINLGIIPGMGGTQRLAWAVGKSKAMEMCLTGRLMSAEEAESAGLVARVVPADELMDVATHIAKTIANKSLVASRAAKEAVNAMFEMPLQQGLRFERRLFHSLFASEDQTEGMEAFIAKRTPDFKHR